jgi:hypothetical protein
MTASAKGCTEASRVKILPGCIGLHAYKIEPLQKQKRVGCHWLQHTDVTHVHMNSLPDVFNTSRFPDGAVSCMYLSSIGSRTGAMSIYQATADGLPLPSFRTRVPPTFRCQRLPLYMICLYLTSSALGLHLAWHSSITKLGKLDTQAA